MSEIFHDTFSYKLIYIFSVDIASHAGCLKIGEATIHSKLDADDLPPNCEDLKAAAKERIKTYTNTVGIKANLLYTELAVREKTTVSGKTVREGFHDKTVHAVLEHSNIAKKVFPGTTADEWFIVDLSTAKKAIAAVKHFKPSLNSTEITHEEPPIQLREEQLDAVSKTLSRFKTKNDMLWDAKMRFGKTLTALQVVKEGHYRRVAIITHRPVVGSGWAEDFRKIFRKDDAPYHFIDKSALSAASYDAADQKANDAQLAKLDKSGENFIYFASIQDLRGSQRVGGKFAKNEGVFSLNWDLVIVDEAHEGTQTNLGEAVIEQVVKPKTKVLALSGTPFNILDHYDEDAVYVWDYVMEQSRKEHWDEKHPGEPNPYADLPRLNIFTYSLGENFTGYTQEDLEGKAFNFREFFRTWTGDSDLDGRKIPAGQHVGDFVHETDVVGFLNLITKASTTSRYPFSTAENRALFKHTLWMVPGVAAAKALSELLRKHPIFKNFGIANVAGEGDDFEETKYADALKMVKDTIKDHAYTITLSCGKLTTGVTVKEWTGVLMLAGSVNTAAASYMQTIFRVQSAGQIDGKQKENAYVFDFAPDRTIRVLAETVQLSRKVAKNDSKEEKSKQALSEFLNYCSVIAIEGTEMRSYDVPKMMSQLKHIFVMKAIRNGFDDTAIYSDKLMKLGKMDARKFEMLKGIVGTSKQTNRLDSVVVDDEGFDAEEHAKGQKKPKKQLTDEQKAEKEAKAKARRERDHAISILRAISIRMPLLIYGADVPCEEDISLKKFATIVDQDSWTEFMPNGVTKEIFAEFIEYYDETVFIAAGKEIRRLARSADKLAPTERVQQIARIFSYFKNPDKETVLTPWRVVNMHMSDTLGGWCFWNKNFTEPLEEPRHVIQKDVTAALFNKPDVKVLELNSKSGLYPLYIAYSLYRHQLGMVSEKAIDQNERMKIWKNVVARNLFVVCKTRMAESITRRTLLGYSNGQLNTLYYEKLVEVLQKNPQKFINKVCGGNAWKNKEFEMKMLKFDAVVGNPPYQAMDGGNKNSSVPVYHLFALCGISLMPNFVSMIMPSRWFSGGRGLDSFRNQMLHDKRISTLVDYFNASECFPGVEIKGGVCYWLWNSAHNADCTITTHIKGNTSTHMRPLLQEGMDTFVRNDIQIDILTKIRKFNEATFDQLMHPGRFFGFHTKVEWEDEIHGTIQTADGSDTIKMVAKADGNHPIKVYAHGGEFYIALSKIPKNRDVVSQYKVILPRSGNPGSTIIGKPKISEPNSCSSNSYVIVYDTASKMSHQRAINIIQYIKTYFFRFLVATKSSTQDLPLKAYSFVPVQDFSQSWDDAKLYKKYGITDQEQKFIESMIKPMA